MPQEHFGDRFDHAARSRKAARRERGLQGDSRRLVSRRREDPLLQLRQIGLGQPDCVLPDSRMLVCQGSLHRLRVKAVKPLQDPQGVQPGAWAETLLRNGLQLRGHGSILSLHEESVRGPPVPAVGMLDQRDQVLGGS